MFVDGKAEGDRTLGRRRHNWEDDIKIELKEYGGRCELDSSSLG
jgi:hypothetical protein